MKDDPKEFVSEQDDICGEQKSGTIKCNVAQLLNGLTENVEGMLQFVANFAFDVINKCAKTSLQNPSDLSQPETTVA